jgi:hypothetical protein
MSLGRAIIASRYQPLGPPRVGGKEERRQVYTRFQEAVVAYVMQVRDSWMTPAAMELEPAQRKPYVDALLRTTVEMTSALYELRMVGNPGPIEAAENVRQAVSDAFDAAAARREAPTAGEANAYALAMHQFTSACRLDLWYQPSWWHAWRGEWWKARWRQVRRRRADELEVGTRRVAAEQTPGIVYPGPLRRNGAPVPAPESAHIGQASDLLPLDNHVGAVVDMVVGPRTPGGVQPPVEGSAADRA